MLKKMSITEFANRVASSKPIMPAGGCVTALAGLMAVSLIEMSADLSVGWSKTDESMKDKMQEDLAQLHENMLEYIDRDADAYNMVLAANKLKREDEKEQYSASMLQNALVDAIEVPLGIGNACLNAMESGIQLLVKVKPSAMGDLKVGMVIAKASFEGALATAKSNLALITDEILVEAFSNQINEQQARFDRLIID